MTRYHLNTLNKEQKDTLLNYLVKYSADSDLIESAGSINH
jgi:hypothetical protein